MLTQQATKNNRKQQKKLTVLVLENQTVVKKVKRAKRRSRKAETPINLSQLELVKAPEYKDIKDVNRYCHPWRG
ncbi:hypothetical protein F9B85_12340 [Heliorestis acidaminivorans]|uniref:Uncharacterized protein n=1 Tax=Heliorestis acidaminivorans TaxID=553427 RepID=A0A6I0EP22_9FIRM|nr:hypothetical protein [Heliorestis acidaminivorans]KAB2951581.1 hypothetical protein F9B85_12340 [Heliorestis acidaminivorans]